MNKVIKNFFPIVSIIIIVGTFFLLNKTQEKVNSVVEVDNVSGNNTKIVEKENEENQIDEIESSYAIPIDDKENQKQLEQQNEERAIGLAADTYGEINNVYYSNEGIEDGKYIIAVRDISTTTAKIYYIVDIENEVVEIYY